MTVELIDHMGDDLRIVNAARVSYGKRSTAVPICSNPGCDQILVESVGISADVCPDHGPINFPNYTVNKADAGLINYLMKNRHGTPFEMVVYTFHVTCPIGVSREWMRHRIGSFNEISTRYVEMEPDCYVPEGPAVRKQVGKPGHYEMVPLDSDSDREMIQQEMHRAYVMAHEHYQSLLDMGVAKEVARNVLPLGQMTQFYWTVNLRSLFNFLSLRTHETALLEIRTEASQVLELARPVVPVCFEAWERNQRIAP